jgi:glycosyltransferase involved in cell wall biosynthesis
MYRVLSVIHYPTFGGPHNRNAKLAPVLLREGFETIVLLPNEEGNAADRLRGKGVTVLAVPLVRLRAKINPIYHVKLAMGFWADVRRLRRIIREQGIHLVQINGLVNSQAAFAARLERVPIVWQILDTVPPMLLRLVCMWLVKRLSAVVMCTGRKVAQVHPGAERLGKRLVLFYPPVDLEQFKSTKDRRESARERLGLKESDKVIGTVANLNPQKGHRTFIEAAVCYREYDREARFVVLGGSHASHRAYANMIAEEVEVQGFSLGDNFIIRDPGADVAEMETAFDVFWATSEPNSEGIPTASEEAMALGIPIVATDVGSVREIVAEGETGYVVQPHDSADIAAKTDLILSSRDLRGAMAKEARRVAVEKFSVESCVKRHVYAYNLALGLLG